MEPMTLGSPTSSPSALNANSPFLPSFLIGDIPPNTPQSSNLSPGRNKTSSSFKGDLNLNNSESRTLRQKLFSQTSAESPTQANSPFIQSTEKVGPPTIGLFDTLDMAKKATTPILSSTAATAHPYDHSIFNDSLSRIHPEETFTPNKSFGTARGLEKIDSLWVTVFGFPPNASNLVLSHLSNCGAIVDKHVPEQGNWMHVKFSNMVEVSRALSLNGKCITNNIMIGVQLHYNKEKRDSANPVSTPIRGSRPLRRSFISPYSNGMNLSQNVPQKSTGIVSKAMEYVFGW